LLALKEFKEF
jgi:hypothetical protein